MRGNERGRWETNGGILGAAGRPKGKFQLRAVSNTILLRAEEDFK
jgi:hypothetical protein